MDAIIVQKLRKKFKDVLAVDSISFSVKTGEIFGLLGPNGAGKTTTINMLSTLIKPTSGKAMICGHEIQKERNSVRNCIGIVFQEPALDTKLTGRENLDFHAMIYGMNRQERKARVEEVLKLVELTDKANVLVEKYSGGMKRRLEIARGLMHCPKVLFLDEPTLGLDTQTRRHIWDYIIQLNKSQKVTIILTTHYMEEADFLCNRIAIIDRGKIVAMDTPAKLKDVLGGDVVTVSGDGLEKLEEALENVEWIKTMKPFNSSLSLTMSRGDTRIPEILSTAEGLGVKVKSVNLHKPSLEDVFLHFTGRMIRDQEGSGVMDRMKMRFGK